MIVRLALLILIVLCVAPMAGCPAPMEGSDAPLDAPALDVPSSTDAPGPSDAPLDAPVLDAPADAPLLDAADAPGMDAPVADGGSDAGSDAGADVPVPDGGAGCAPYCDGVTGSYYTCVGGRLQCSCGPCAGDPLACC